MSNSRRRRGRAETRPARTESDEERFLRIWREQEARDDTWTAANWNRLQNRMTDDQRRVYIDMAYATMLLTREDAAHLPERMDPAWREVFVQAWKGADARLSVQRDEYPHAWGHDVGEERLRDAMTWTAPRRHESYLTDVPAGPRQSPLDEAVRLLLQPSGLKGLTPDDAWATWRVRNLLLQKANEVLRYLREVEEVTNANPLFRPSLELRTEDTDPRNPGPSAGERAERTEHADPSADRTAAETLWSPAHEGFADPDTVPGGPHPGTALDAVEDRLLHEQLESVVTRALKELPDLEAQAVFLRYLSPPPGARELPWTQCGAALGCRWSEAKRLALNGLRLLAQSDDPDLRLMARELGYRVDPLTGHRT